jgi:hypothetical protein
LGMFDDFDTAIFWTGLAGLLLVILLVLGQRQKHRRVAARRAEHHAVRSWRNAATTLSYCAVPRSVISTVIAPGGAPILRVFRKIIAVPSNICWKTTENGRRTCTKRTRITSAGLQASKSPNVLVFGQSAHRFSA